MRIKSVTIKAAWITFSAVIVGAIISGLFNIYSPDTIEDNKTNSINTNTNEGVISGNVENQTNNFYQSDTVYLNNNQEQKKENTKLKSKDSVIAPKKNNNKKANTNLYIENMSGGYAIGNVENLNINNKDALDLLPFHKCADLNIQQKANKSVIELKVNQGEWDPIMIGIPFDEKNQIDPSIFDTKSTIIPGIINFQSSGTSEWVKVLEINNKKIKYWFKLFQSPKLSKKNSFFVECKELPSSIVWGIYPDKALIYQFNE